MMGVSDSIVDFTYRIKKTLLDLGLYRIFPIPFFVFLYSILFLGKVHMFIYRAVPRADASQGDVFCRPSLADRTLAQ